MTNPPNHLFKHIGSFCLILFFALFRPAAIWPEVPVSTAPLAVFTAWLILLIKIHATEGYDSFLRRHRLIICLVGAYFVLCGASLIANYHRYSDLAGFVRWGLTFPIIQSTLVACFFLFNLPQNANGPSLTRLPGSTIIVFAIAVTIPSMALWQALDNNGAYEIYQYTVAGDMGNIPYNRRGILAVSTDLGSVSAILSIAALLLTVKTVQTREWLWVIGSLLIFALNAISGVSSGSRGFFLSFGVGMLALIVFWLRDNITLMLQAVLAFAAVGVLTLQYAPTQISTKLNKIIPIFLSSNIGLPVDMRDMIPSLSTAALGDRANLWQRAIEQSVANPWFGVSNGGYRLMNESLGETPINNTHNAFVQLGVDAGVGGLILGLALIALLIRQCQNTAVLVLFITALGGLLVDNFVDHSLAWIVLTTFSLASMANLPVVITRASEQIKKIQTGLLIVTTVAATGVAANYYSTSQVYKSYDLANQINAAEAYFWDSYWSDPPILISDKLREAVGAAQVRGNLSLYGSVPFEHVCAYAYSGAKLLHLASEKGKSLQPKSRAMGIRWGLIEFDKDGCIDESIDPEELELWTSNHHKYFLTRGLSKNGDRLRMSASNIRFFSPMLDASKQQNIEVTATLTGTKDHQPVLEMSFLDGATGELIVEQAFVVSNETQKISMLLPRISSGLGYIRLRLRKWSENVDIAGAQQVIIKSINIEIPPTS